MNGKERIITALSVQQPDRVPLYIHGINEAPIIGIGKHITDGLPESKQFYEMNDSEKMKLLDTLFLIHEVFGVDGFTSFEIGHDTEIDNENVRDDWGVIYRRNPHGLPVPVGHPVKDAADLIKFHAPEPNRGHLLLHDLARDRFKGDVALFWMMRGVFVHSWRLTGMENYMLKMYEDPEFIHNISAMVTEYNLKQLAMLATAGIDVLVVEDDIAATNNLLISPKHFMEFVNPYNRKLVDRAHELGLKVVRHSDGNLWSIMDILIESGYDGLNPLEPQAGMDLKKVKDKYGDKICLLGNIDCKELLPSGTPDQVDAAVKHSIEVAAAGGGYILCDSNSLHPGVNPENCIAMFEATKKYGLYE
ncbi:MAG: uroporphyrinogen decarboxylase family protein [Pseudomonadota bacterium]